MQATRLQLKQVSEQRLLLEEWLCTRSLKPSRRKRRRQRRRKVVQSEFSWQVFCQFHLFWERTGSSLRFITISVRKCTFCRPYNVMGWIQRSRLLVCNVVHLVPSQTILFSFQLMTEDMCTYNHIILVQNSRDVPQETGTWRKTPTCSHEWDSVYVPDYFKGAQTTQYYCYIRLYWLFWVYYLQVYTGFCKLHSDLFILTSTMSFWNILHTGHAAIDCITLVTHSQNGLTVIFGDPRQSGWRGLGVLYFVTLVAELTGRKWQDF